MSLALLLDMAVSGHDDRIALGPRAAGISFAELGARAAGGGAVVGQHAPSHVVFIGRNGPAYPQVMFSAARAGVPFVPLRIKFELSTVKPAIRGWVDGGVPTITL